MFEKEESSRWFKENTPEEGLSENTTFTRQFLIDAWDNGYINGYNKANEWHKADEKPKVTKEYLVYLISGYNCRSVTMMIYNAERGFWCADNQNDVVYWKEIVLPKESE